jgi:hypothetical protein
MVLTTGFLVCDLQEVCRGLRKKDGHGVAGMGISVIFTNGDERMVPAYMLDYLIRESRIVAFLRSDGWVQIGRDPFRKTQLPLTRPGERWSDFLFKRPQAG